MSGLFGAATGARPLTTAMLDQMVEFGVESIRKSAQWDRIEPTLGGGRDWKTTDEIVAACEARGLGLVLEGGSRSTDLYGDGIVKQYASWLAELAARYEGRIRATATCNEPNNQSFAKQVSGKLNAQLQIAAYEAIKKVAPALPVLTGGLASGNKGRADGFLADMYAAGVKDHFDALAFHPYSHPRSWGEAMKAESDGPWYMHLARQVMKANGDKAKQVWVTEYGVNTGGARSFVTPAVQHAQLLEAATWCRARAWIGDFYVFTWSDNPNNDPMNYGDTMGVVDVNGAAKPAAHIFKELTT